MRKKKKPAFLLHFTGHWPAGSEIDAPIIYADYYYMEALLRLWKMKREERNNQENRKWNRTEVVSTN